jgi:hypothetical protein
MTVKSAGNTHWIRVFFRGCMVRTGWAANEPTHNGCFLLWTEMLIWIGRRVVCIGELVAMANYFFIIGGTAVAV